MSLLRLGDRVRMRGQIPVMWPDRTAFETPCGRVVALSDDVEVAVIGWENAHKRTVKAPYAEWEKIA